MGAQVVIVEDDATVAAHVATCLEAHPDLTVRAIVASLQEAAEWIDAHVDLFIIDLGLPDGSGISLIKDIRRTRQDHAKILILSTLGDRDSVMSAVLAGADGYLLKWHGSVDMARQAAETLSGQAPLSPDIATHLLRHVRAQDSISEATSSDRRRRSCLRVSWSCSDCSLKGVATSRLPVLYRFRRTQLANM